MTDSLALSTCYQPHLVAGGTEVLCSSAATLDLRIANLRTGTERPLNWGGPANFVVAVNGASLSFAGTPITNPGDGTIALKATQPFQLTIA